MKRLAMILSTLAILLTASGAFANRYVWTISGSPVDPLVNTGAPGATTLWVWFFCGDVGGMMAAEFRFATSGAMFAFSAVPIVPFFNLGTFPDLALSVAGCPSGPLPAVQVFLSDGGGEACLAPSIMNDLMVAIDCQPLPQMWDVEYIGYNSVGGAPCSLGGFPCAVSVEESSWGSIKSLYR